MNIITQPDLDSMGGMRWVVIPHGNTKSLLRELNTVPLLGGRLASMRHRESQLLRPLTIGNLWNTWIIYGQMYKYLLLLWSLLSLYLCPRHTLCLRQSGGGECLSIAAIVVAIAAAAPVRK